MSDPAEHPGLDAPAILAVLESLGVQYVVVGGYAAELHGASRPTYDVDVTPSRSRENLDRLAAALKQLGARIRTDAVEGGLPFSVSGDSLAGLAMLNLVTPLGELDLTFEPAGVGVYENWVAGATLREIGPVRVHVAALEDVIRSKEAAARPKDQLALPELRDLAARSRRAGRLPTAT